MEIIIREKYQGDHWFPFPPPDSQVMYFSSLFPYVVLFCFLVRGLMLKGSVDGIAHMFTPKVRLKQERSLFNLDPFNLASISTDVS